MAAKKLNCEMLKFNGPLTGDVTFYVCSIHFTNWINSYGPEIIKTVGKIANGEKSNHWVEIHVNNLIATYGRDIVQNYILTVWGPQ